MSVKDERKLNLLEALDYIDPAALSYTDWVRVGMGLKEAGYPASAWENWSRRDAGRYHSGECLKKWNSFRDENIGPPVTGAIVAKMAMDNGWKSRGRGTTDATEMDWNAVIGSRELWTTAFPRLARGQRRKRFRSRQTKAGNPRGKSQSILRRFSSPTIWSVA